MGAFELELSGAPERIQTASFVGLDDSDFDIAPDGAIDGVLDTHDDGWFPGVRG